MMPIATQLKMNDVVVATALRLFCAPNSNRLSENMGRGANAGSVDFFPWQDRRTRATCRLDFFYLWFMDFSCAHRNLPALPSTPFAGVPEDVISGYITAISMDIFVLSGWQGKWPTSRLFVIEITEL